VGAKVGMNEKINALMNAYMNSFISNITHVCQEVIIIIDQTINLEGYKSKSLFATSTENYSYQYFRVKKSFFKIFTKTVSRI
jgi:hypothetical protein